MHTQLIHQFSTAEIHVDSDTLIKLSKDDNGRYTLIVASPGSRIACVRIMRLSELQIRNLCSQIVEVL